MRAASLAIWELTPITSPCSLSSGPPELPGLSAASVWIAPVIFDTVGSCDFAVERGDDAAGERLVEAIGIADRIHRIADLDRAGARQVQRLQAQAGGIDADQREVAVRFLAHERRRVGSRSRTSPGRSPARCPRDDVVVGEDQAFVVEHDARTAVFALRGDGLDRRRHRRNHVRRPEWRVSPVEATSRRVPRPRSLVVEAARTRGGRTLIGPPPETSAEHCDSATVGPGDRRRAVWVRIGTCFTTTSRFQWDEVMLRASLCRALTMFRKGR